MNEDVDFEPGDYLSFGYPDDNESGVVSAKRSLRRMQLKNLRDTVKNPLDPITLALNPKRTRGRWLATGIDLVTGREKSYYCNLMTDVSVESQEIEHHSAVAIIKPLSEWQDESELPERFEVVRILKTNIPNVVATVIADGANQVARAIGESYRAIVCSSFWANQFHASP